MVNPQDGVYFILQMAIFIKVIMKMGLRKDMENIFIKRR